MANLDAVATLPSVPVETALAHALRRITIERDAVAAEPAVFGNFAPEPPDGSRLSPRR